MSTVLLLARDFVERLSNPMYGPAVNEDYGMRLATALGTEGFEKQLSEEVRRLDDPEAFTSHGWLWLLGWARSKNVELRADLLEVLFEHSSSAFVRTAILAIAVHQDSVEFGGDVNDVHEFPDRFLAAVMSAAVQSREDSRFAGREAQPSEREPATFQAIPATAAAELTLISLLQSGKPITLSAASTLLRHKWQGQIQLNEFFRTLTDGLDEDTRREWLRRVRTERSESDS